MLAEVEKFLATAREKKELIHKIAKTDPFALHAKKFTRAGITPTQSMCWSEGSVYDDLVSRTIKTVTDKLKAYNNGVGEKFRSTVENAYDYSGMCFNPYRKSSIEDYFDFINDTKVSNTITEYFIMSDPYDLITTLFEFASVYTEMMLVNAPNLLSRIKHLMNLFGADDSALVNPTDLDGYRSVLTFHAFQSLPATHDVAIQYMRCLIKQCKFVYRILPPDYVEPLPPPIPKPERKREETNQSVVSCTNLNQNINVITKQMSTATNFNSKGGSQYNNTGAGSQNTGSGIQHTNIGDHSSSSSPANAGWKAKLLGDNASWIAVLLGLIIGSGYGIIRTQK